MTVRPIRLLAGFLTVGAWTMASRVFGFLRDMAVAAVLGAGPVAEAFFVAFTLPNLFRRFFAEGAFNTAFVPLFAKRLEGDGRAAATTFAEEAFAALAALLIALTLFATLAMPWLVLALASGFAGDARFDLATGYGRIVFPYILFISLAALLSGVLNAAGRFAAAAAAPVVLNLVLIGALWLASTGVFGPAGEGLYGLTLSVAVLVAGLLQLAVVWAAAARAGFRVLPRLPRLTPGLRRLAVIAFPAALAGGVVQVNLVLARQVASYYDGAVAWLWLADRVYQLPLGVVGVAIGVVLLPELARRVRAEDAAGSADALNRATEFALALTLPATVALVAVPGLVCAVLFERGAFGPEDTAATAAALAIYALGLPAFVLQKVVQPAYFAREDTATPLRYAVVSMAVNLVAAVGLMPLAGYLAAPLGTTLAGWVNLLLLARGAPAAGVPLSIDAGLARRAPRILLASLAMGAAVVAIAVLATDHAGLPRWLALALVVAGGAAAYAALAAGLGAVTRAELRTALSRRPRPAP